MQRLLAVPILQQPVNFHMNRLMFGLLLGWLSLSLSACANLADSRIQDPVLGTDTPGSPTATTFVWFPPSATPSPAGVPTREATPERKPGIGDVLLADDFSSPSAWSTGGANQQGVFVGGNRITIAVMPGAAPVFSFRQGEVFGDFYAEITARPSLCRAADDYGLLFRAPNNVAYYRFAVACNGTAGADRVSLGTPRVLQVPLLSGDVPAGVPGEVRMGVWAAGSEFRFFLNGRYQFTANDGSYATGAIGVFARAAGSTPVTVAFSDLVVQRVSHPLAALSPTP